nr:MAG TPA: hypothetical protein [Caudoviricetes sp.]
MLCGGTNLTKSTGRRPCCRITLLADVTCQLFKVF